MEPLLAMAPLRRSQFAMSPQRAPRHRSTPASAHLGIAASEYDRRIRTFIPYYTEMLGVVAKTAAQLVPARPVIVDLGVGTGALAARCLHRVRHAQLHGIDADAEMLGIARQRLAPYGERVRLALGSFARTPLPRCDAIVTTLALHHIPSPRTKGRVYARCRAALRDEGILINGDVMLSDHPDLRPHHMARWERHLHRTYSARETRQFFTTWTGEDHYLPLGSELVLLTRAGFRVEVLWRRPPFAIVLARAGSRRAPHR